MLLGAVDQCRDRAIHGITAAPGHTTIFLAAPADP
jgi:hypothetical protein